MVSELFQGSAVSTGCDLFHVDLLDDFRWVRVIRARLMAFCKRGKRTGETFTILSKQAAAKPLIAAGTGVFLGKDVGRARILGRCAGIDLSFSIFDGSRRLALPVRKRDKDGVRYSHGTIVPWSETST